ncbi:MAG: TM0106 family RecB-like putative nuclease [Syntrophorhabdaceae bacterium]|nr:TM0106 family RecB-like putative nuclease [Syntrophorhabdaceae bacterium]
MHGHITASMLYNLIQCPHRLSLDLHEDPAGRDPESKFVELLWEKGTLFENEVMSKLGIPFTDLSTLAPDEKERYTLEAMEKKTPLIYSGRIRSGDLLGEPDLLRFHEQSGYVAGDIKSGAGEEGDEDADNSKPKKHYAVQLSLYTDALVSTGYSRSKLPFIWDIHGKEITYDLDAAQGSRTPQTLWQLYEEKLGQARTILTGPGTTMPAMGATCKQCHWKTLCRDQVRKLDDLTLIAELGRAKRDTLAAYFRTVDDLARMDPKDLPTIKGTGKATLEKFQVRAQLLTDPRAVPFCRTAFCFPKPDLELFFDIEVDPMRDICYLHGFVERRDGDNGTEKFIPFLAGSPTSDEEERAFAKAWEYIRKSQPCAVYFYSKYERTWWKKLQQRYPSVVSEEDIASLFDSELSVDLYFDVVKKHTEWPTNDQSIKTLASYLGFKWRDVSPSGADSIEWYHRWVESGDPAVRQRILDYNEDDCRAMRVLLDGLGKLDIR